ncbi:transglutaminase-like domain-containing protein [Niabella ginsengisoli]|uniref:Transglutaminase family protein n=1 Tax=Niabella ginsengisoli TaxID=522298 RepID=A0ABS9SG94_9BACT|nr:transglutaminase family protein [Niabella ginsengisoli]MCH5597377.1 transglutaminase family protein [Niabella ginsengisoli]
MKFKVSSELSYNIKSDTTFFFNIQAAQTKSQTIIEEQLVTSPGKIKIEPFDLGVRKARFLRVHVTKPGHFKINYTATVELHLKSVRFKKESDLKANTIHPDAVSYLFPSRYCQADRMYKFAEMEFKNIKTTYGKVTAICNWIYKTVHYVSGSTNANTSAIETITQREGVCRDFAHLGIVMCRALSIPARYIAAYAYQLNPPDFHACFEAYIDGKWILFDATRMVPLHGLVKIAHGYDAADTSFANIFGEADPLNVVVSCEALDKKAFENAGKKLKTISYE